jgi:Mrp family chromosome partitioning ATPase
VVVSTPQDVALKDAVKGVAMFQKVDVPVSSTLLVISFTNDNRSWEWYKTCLFLPVLIVMKVHTFSARRELNENARSAALDSSEMYL